MDIPLTISYNNLEGTPLLGSLIEDHANRLKQRCDDIVAIHITVELQQKNLRSGSNYRVCVELMVSPAENRVADYVPAETEPPVPLQAAVQRAFAQAEQLVDELVTQRQGTDVASTT